jgi:hypothetical protein
MDKLETSKVKPSSVANSINLLPSFFVDIKVNIANTITSKTGNPQKTPRRPIIISRLLISLSFQNISTHTGGMGT